MNKKKKFMTYFEFLAVGTAKLSFVTFILHSLKKYIFFVKIKKKVTKGKKQAERRG